MKKRKIGIILIVTLALVGCRLLWEYIDDKHDEKLLQTVQNADIGDGVTLSRGIQAYCGQSGNWYVYNDTIKVNASDSNNSISATLKANIKTDDVEVLEFYHDLALLDRDDMMAVINDMVQAVKNVGK